jgi:hypothetical protein
MNKQIKSVLKNLLICLAASFILIAVQVSAVSISMKVICKVASASLTVWSMWNLVKLAYLLIIEFWSKTISKLKNMFTKRHATLNDQTLISKIKIKVHNKPNQLLYETDFEDTYQYGR